jgi:tetratricopeptide (TPR) repeat protein
VVRAAICSFVAAISVSSACVSRRPPGIDPDTRIAEADRLVHAGCYTCLRDAATIYENLPPVAASRTLTRRIETLLLLAVRSRELDLGGSWLEQADLLLTNRSTPELRVYRAIVDHIRAPAAVKTPEELEADATRARAARDQLVRDAAVAIDTKTRVDAVAAYFRLALACSESMIGVPAAVMEVSPNVRDAPLVAFAMGTCSPDAASRLDELVTHDVKWTDVHYYRAMHLLRDAAIVSADAALAAAIAAFPDSRVVHLARARVYLTLEEFEAALEGFDYVAGRVPGQRDALLGRLVALSALGRHVDAENASNRLLELGTWHIGDAYYWRAWNRRRLNRLDEAAADIATAESYVINAAVYKLAGFIAYERDRQDEALRHLNASLERNASDCDVQFALGQVHGRRGEWAEAACSFGSAADCARDAQPPLRSRLEEIAASNLAPDRRARLRAGAERKLADVVRQEGLAAIAAAELYVRLNRTEGRTFAERASRWEEHREAASRLLSQLSK